MREETCDYCTHKGGRGGRKATHELDGERFCEAHWGELVEWLETPNTPPPGEYEVVG